LFDAALEQLKKLPTSKTAKLFSDVSLFRQGLFYANTGGHVPGDGNSDSVPAMLTPGEFVIRKKAAKALGLSNLLALNNTQNFAAGGPVLLSPSISMPRVSGLSRVPQVSRTSGAGVVNEFNTPISVTVNNPTGENSVYSMQKALRKMVSTGAINQAALRNTKEA
jgi:hypothetical protein